MIHQTIIFLVISVAMATNAAPSITSECKDLPAPENGDVQTLYSVDGGQLAVFICDTDYAALGTTTLSCEKGEWSHNPPQCVSVAHCNLQNRIILPEPVDKSIAKCGELSPPRYGELEFKIGDDGRSEIAVFSCVPGYYISGSSAIYCEEGSWKGQQPQCLPVDCGAPEAPANGTVVFDETSYTSRARYQCTDCHVLEGYEERVCKRSGLWSKTVPKCILRNDVERCTLSDLPRGAFLPSRDNQDMTGVACGEELVIRCFSGYRLRGADTATCNPDGSFTWHGIRPHCQRLFWTR